MSTVSRSFSSACDAGFICVTNITWGASRLFAEFHQYAVTTLVWPHAEGSLPLQWKLTPQIRPGLDGHRCRPLSHILRMNQQRWTETRQTIHNKVSVAVRGPNMTVSTRSPSLKLLVIRALCSINAKPRLPVKGGERCAWDVSFVIKPSVSPTLGQ